MTREPDFSRPDKSNLLSLHIPIGAAWSILAAVVVAAVWTSWQLWDLRQSIKDGTSDRWKRSYQREYTNRMRANNPSLKIPDPDQIVKDLD